MGDPNIDCECKYCAKKTQREVTASMSNILRNATPSLSQSPAPSRIIRPLPNKGKARANIPRVAEARQRDTKNYAAIQKSIKPLKASSTVLKQPMLVERSNDLRAVYSKSAQHIRRWYREGEIVWCALPRPISSVNKLGDRVTLEYWPAVVDEVKLKSETVPRASTAGHFGSASLPSAAQPVASSSATQIAPMDADDGRGPMLLPSDKPLPWTVRQYARYKVHFLAVSHSTTIDDDDILPYQANMPSEELIEVMAEHPPERLMFDKTTITNFNPCPAGDVPSLFDAIPPFALAIQIASAISQSWCLTDEYELKYTIPQIPSASAPPPRPPPSFQSSSISSASSRIPQQPQPNSLQAAIEAANRHNDNLTRATIYESASAVHPSMPASTAQQTASRMIGMPPPPGQLRQIRYQGMWWGAERIWVDDFVRLKVPRRALAPTGDNHILAPAGPSKTEQQEYQGPDEERHFLGAQMRGTFLRLDGIIIVDVEDNGQVTKQARLTGRLYELVALDWQGEEYHSKAPIIRPPIIPRQPAEGAGAVERTNSGPPVDHILPAAPTGYKFREILEPGYEFVGTMGLLSGRYYPGILKHPRLLSRVARAIHSPDPQRHAGLWSLEGLSGGLFNSVDPWRYKKGRHTMMQDADKEAASVLDEYVRNTIAERGAGQHQPFGDGDAMDVDGM